MNRLDKLSQASPVPLPSSTMAEVQNSNPTILNVADLPTRTRSTEKPGDQPSGIFAAVPNPADFLSSDSEDDDLLEEPIDEQEIYGTVHPSPLISPPIFRPFLIQTLFLPLQT